MTGEAIPELDEELLSAYLDGELSDEQRREFQARLASEPILRERLVTYQQAWDRSIAQIKKAVPLAKELGVKISIENVWNNFILSPIEAVKFLDEIGDPIVGWHFDIGNVLRYGWPEHWIPVLGQRINRIHVKEYSTKKMKDEGVWKGFDCDLTEGTNNWAAIMKALDSIGYTGWAISEQRGGINPNGLRMLVERMDKIFAM